jgi:hypothetical protein
LWLAWRSHLRQQDNWIHLLALAYSTERERFANKNRGLLGCIS